MAEHVNNVEMEFILREALNLALPLHLHGAGKTGTAFVHEIRKDALLLSMQGTSAVSFVPWENLAVYFDFHGKDITFKTKVLKQSEANLVLSYPEFLLRAPARKHPRVPCPQGFSLELTLENEKVHLDYPQSGEYSDVSLPDLHEGFDVSSLNALVESFRKRSSDMASEHRTVFFKGRTPEGIEEKLLAHFGKTLFIPSTRSSLPSKDPYPESRIITSGMIAEFEGLNDLRDGSPFDRSLISKIGRGINAEVWCPIQYFQYVVGYVYMANKADRPRSMDFAVVDCAWEFSRVLAFYLKTHDYFKSSETSEPVVHPAGIVDLSASGCLLSIPHTTLAMRIKTGAMLDLRLTSPDGSLSTRGKVVRRYDDKGGAYYGVAFQEVQKKDLEFLYPKIYQLPYEEADYALGEARLHQSGVV